MKYDFIEIGTSDFRTLATGTLKGIIVEPVKRYIDNIPNREGLTKFNCAIGPENKKVKLYFCCPDIIDLYSLPKWLRGCNSIEVPHPSVIAYCKTTGINYDTLVKVDEVNCITIADLFIRNDVTELDFLKVDTEGTDYDIMISLFDFLEHNLYCIIQKIQYESNILMPDVKKKELIRLAEKAGYWWFISNSRGTEDTILTLNG